MWCSRLASLVCLSAAALAGPNAARADDAAEPARATLTRARTVLLSRLDAAKRHSDDAYDIVERIEEAIGSLDSARARDDAAYATDRALAATLDAAWIDAVTTGTCPAVDTRAGARESCVVSSSDGTLQPVALYRPAALGLQTPAAVVVILRGRNQTESDLLARHELRALADETGALLVAPYARGRATYDRTATSDVFDALDAVARVVPLDRRRIYIAGFSMGGIAAFHVAGAAPGRFKALLAIAGALDGDDRNAMRALSDSTAYVVNGERDEAIAPEHGRATVTYLRSIGVRARYYEQAGGTHSLGALLPAITRAWHDMFAGITTPRGDGATVPSAVAPPITRSTPRAQPN